MKLFIPYSTCNNLQSNRHSQPLGFSLIEVVWVLALLTLFYSVVAQGYVRIDHYRENLRIRQLALELTQEYFQRSRLNYAMHDLYFANSTLNTGLRNAGLSENIQTCNQRQCSAQELMQFDFNWLYNQLHILNKNINIKTRPCAGAEVLCMVITIEEQPFIIPINFNNSIYRHNIAPHTSQVDF